MAPCLSLIPFISTHALKSWHPPTSKHQPQRSPLKGSFRKELFKGRMSTNFKKQSFCILGQWFAQTSSQIISGRVKTLSNTNWVIVKHVVREKASLPVDVHRSKCLHLLLPIIKQARLLNKRPLLSPLTFLKQQGYKENLFLFPIY